MNQFKNALPNENLMQELGLLLQESHPHDPQLIELLVRHYGLPLYRFLVVLVESDTDAPQHPPLDDLVCQSFLRGFARLNRFQEYADVNVWIFSSAYQTYLARNSTNGRKWGTKKRILSPQFLSSTIAVLYFGFGLDISAIAEVTASGVNEIEETLKADYATFQQMVEGEPLTSEKKDALIRQKWQARLTLITVPDEKIGIWPARIQKRAPHPPRTRFSNLVLWQKAAPFALLLLIFLGIFRVAFDGSFRWEDILPAAPTPDPYYEQFQNQPNALPYASWKPELPDEDEPLPREAYLFWQYDRSARVGSNQITDLAYSPDGSFLVFIDQSLIKLLSLEQGAITQLKNPTPVASELALSPDGTLLAVGGGDHQVWVWEVPSGKRLPGWNTPTNSNFLAFSPDGLTLATANDNYVNLWDIQTGTLVTRYGSFTEHVTSLAFSPDGAWLAVGNLKGSIWIQRVDTAETLLIYTNHTDVVNHLMFTADGKSLFSASRDGTALVVELNKTFTQKLKGKVVRTFLHTREPDDKFFVEDVALSPDGKTLVTVTRDGYIAPWNTITWLYQQAPLGGFYRDYSPQVFSLAFSPDGKTLSIGTMGGELEFWKQEDIYEEVMAFPEPIYFHRENANIVINSYETSDFKEPTPISNIESISNLAGFDITKPVTESLPFPVEFSMGGFYPEENFAWLAYVAQLDTQGYVYFNYNVSKIKEALPELNYIYSVGRTAMVEPITIGDTYLEFTSGTWVTPSDLNPRNPMFEQIKPGTKITTTSVWSGSEYLRIGWQDGDYMFSVFTYSDLDQEKTKEMLLQFVTSIIAPKTFDEQIKASLDKSIVPYTVQEGETCTDIASRVGVTPKLIATLNQLEEGCGVLLPGQTLGIPYKGKFWSQVNMACDTRKENIYLLHPLENPDDPTITGVAMDVREAPGEIHRIWTYLAEEMGVLSFETPTFFSIGECEQFLVVRGSIPGEQYRTVVFRTNGNSVWPVLDSVGWPLSLDGSVSNQAETEDEPFRVDLIEWGDEIEPGQCLNHNLRFRWTGGQFEAFYNRYERGECKK